MRSWIKMRLRRLSADEEGMALPFIAAILVLLLGMAAFATDLGWIYLNGSRVQRAADAAALAGVVYLPGDYAGVDTFTTNGANANGYSVGTVNGAPNGSGGSDSIAWTQLEDNELEVTLTSTIDTFFLKVFGFDTMTINRTGTALYVKPVPIGNPDNDFGEGSDNFWASINGRWTAHMHGDPYMTYCDWADGLSDSNCIDSHDPPTGSFSGATLAEGDLDSDGLATNPQFRGDGYYYGVEVQNNRTSLTVSLYHPQFRTGASTGDTDTLTFSPNGSGSNIGPNTRFRLYEPDSTPLDPTDNPTLVCDQTYTRNGPNFGWTDLCTVANPTAGIYVLRVSTNDGSGSNQYGVQVNTTGSGTNDPGIFGINEISIFTNQNNTTATLYLAEVDPIHAGKILELTFYDAGEDDGEASYSVRMPDGSTAACTWEAEGGASGGPGLCNIDTTWDAPGPGWAPLFNAQWLTAEVEIPDDYSCDINGPDPLACWWSMSIVNTSPHDRTTWTARITGNPVHLVPNQ